MVRLISHFTDHKWATREIRRNRSKQCYFWCEGNNYISVTPSKPMANLHIPHSFKHSFRWSDKVYWFISHSPVPGLQQIAFNLRQTTHECVYFVKLVHTNFQPVTLTLTRWPWYIDLTEIFRIFTCTSTVNVPGKKNSKHSSETQARCISPWPWPWPDNLHKRTWPVSSEDIQVYQKWTFYSKAFESYRITHITYRCYRIYYYAVSRVAINLFVRLRPTFNADNNRRSRDGELFRCYRRDLW